MIRLLLMAAAWLPRPKKAKDCTFTWRSADRHHTHRCKYREGHSWPHECICNAQPPEG